MPPRTMSTASLYDKPTFTIVVALLILYIAFFVLSALFLPASAHLYPATAVALAVLFFGGLRLWPVVYLTALLAAILSGMTGLPLLLLPVAVTLQAVSGAYLILKANIDPLFRHLRDMFYLIASSMLVALISPAFGIIQATLDNALYSSQLFLSGYVAALSTLLIFVPFFLRWCAKPGFKRPKAGWFETIAVFAVLIVLDVAIFSLGIQTVAGIPLVYALLVPLFFMALRLRPRFVTLAIVVTSFFAVIALVAAGDGPEALAAKLLSTESFLIALSVVFYIIVSLEEERRVTMNLINSQLDTLKNALARISSESSAKNNFIATLGHELRNPLAPIESGIDILKLSGRRDKKETETLNMMGERMATIRRFLDDLLDISRMSEGKVALKNEAVNLDTALKRAILSTNHHRKELHQRLAVTAPNAPLYVLGDSVRMEQVFSNLLTNASKYSDEGDTIRVFMRGEDRIAEIKIVDEGIGLSPDSLQSIFVPFHQLEHKRTQQGLGIGLALVRTFVEMHRGTVTASSKGLGHGSRFTVRLPLLTPPPNMTPEDELAPNTPESSRRLSLLIVDDNDTAATSIGRLLEILGCTVRYAYNGNQGIEKAGSNPPDIILLDVGLPDMDGFTVATTVRARGYAGRIIALTGYSMPDDKERGGIETAIDHYLVKPASLADLKRVIPELG